MSDTTTPADAPTWLPAFVDAIREALAIPDDARCLSRDQAALAIGISVRKLDELHSANEGPPTMAVGERRLYPVATLKKWIAERIEKH